MFEVEFLLILLLSISAESVNKFADDPEFTKTACFVPIHFAQIFSNLCLQGS